MRDDDGILIAGAGPTGLAAACALWQRGVPCRVVDRRHGPATEPKALVLWSGALEVLLRLGAVTPLLQRSLPLAGSSYWSGGRRRGWVRFDSLAGTAFPKPLCVPQSVTESVLYGRLLELGGDVEWNTELTGVDTADRGRDGTVAVTLRPYGSPDTSVVTPRWLIGADGVHSTVREAVGISFDGGTYARDFLLGDGEFSGELPADEAQYHFTPHGVLVVVPLAGGGHRVFFDRPPGGSSSEPPSEEELQHLLDDRGPGDWTLRHTWWRSTFRVHTKVANRFRSGSVFVAGDAAHCHSPAGGQGLNTGVQDGYNLGWKLAAVAGGADPSLLDSYEAERRPAALRAIRNSDRQTRLWMVRSGIGRTVRDTMLGLATRTGVLDRRLVPELAQLDPGLAGSPAVPGRIPAAGGRAVRGPRAGHRLPDTRWKPLAGTTAKTLHEYLADGRHTLVALYRDAPADDDADRTAELLTGLLDRSPVHDHAGVLLLYGRGPQSGACFRTRPHDARPGPCASAVEHQPVLTAWAEREPLIVYVRPDGAVGAWTTAGNLGEFARRISVLAGGRESAAS